jgi:two-component system, OmpR family, phosphate regulon sensor histidine kinase PhoR
MSDNLVSAAETQQIEELKKEFAYKQALMLTLSNSAYDALLVLNEKFEVIAINDSAEALFERERPLGQSLLAVTNSSELQMIVEDALVNQEEIFEEQLTMNRRFYRIRAQVIRRDGNLFIGLALQDVSELVRLNRARRDMVANISHELRTPIANIRLIIDSLFHEAEKPKRKQSIASLRAIARETDSLLWMAQELLDLSMIESGQAIMRMIEVPLYDLIEEAIERMADQSEAKEITTANHSPKKLQVLCDRDMIRRVLINLIHNAIKWSPKNETITVDAVKVGDEIRISVFDNGPGVPDDQTERIFERFYQVDASRSGGEGTGLGLAICKHIVEAHGGRIWAEDNSQGSGGRFMFTLPAAEEVV